MAEIWTRAYRVKTLIGTDGILLTYKGVGDGGELKNLGYIGRFKLDKTEFPNDFYCNEGILNIIKNSIYSDSQELERLKSKI